MFSFLILGGENHTVKLLQSGGQINIQILFYLAKARVPSLIYLSVIQQSKLIKLSKLFLSFFSLIKECFQLLF